MAREAAGLVHEVPVAVDHIGLTLLQQRQHRRQRAGLQAVVGIQPHHPLARGAVEALVDRVAHPLVRLLDPRRMRKTRRHRRAVIGRAAVDDEVLQSETRWGGRCACGKEGRCMIAHGGWLAAGTRRISRHRPAIHIGGHAPPLLGCLQLPRHAIEALAEEAAVVERGGDEGEVHGRDTRLLDAGHKTSRRKTQEKKWAHVLQTVAADCIRQAMKLTIQGAAASEAPCRINSSRKLSKSIRCGCIG